MRRFLTKVVLTCAFGLAASAASAAPFVMVPVPSTTSSALQQVRLVCRDVCNYTGCRRVCHRVRPRFDRGPWGGPRVFGGYGRGWPTYNGCPPHFTVQDGVCKPYTGR